jgi:tetratricopeptide (TPR) repeat protein
VTADEEEARERLLFHLENQTGFWFALVVGDDARPRARLREAAEAWCQEQGRPFLLYEPEPEALVMLAVTLAKGDSPGVHWIRADGMTALGEAWQAGATQMLMAMNERREAYRKRLDGGVVVEGRPALKRILREMAPDLFSIRAFIAEPGEEARAHPVDIPEWHTPVSLASLSGLNPDPEQSLQQLARLDVFVGAGGARARISALMSTAGALANGGRHEEAENHTRELLRTIDQHSRKEPLDEQVQLMYGAAHSLLGQVAMARDNYEDAVVHFTRAIGILDAWHPGAPTDIIFRTFTQLFCGRYRALALARSGKLDEARDAFENHLQYLTRDPPAVLPAELRIDFLDNQRQLADILNRQDDVPGAEAVLREVVRLATQYASDSPTEDRWQLEIVKGRALLGELLILKGDTAAGIETLRSAIQPIERLEASEPAKGQLSDLVWLVYVGLGIGLYAQQDFSEAALAIQERALHEIQKKYELDQDNVRLGWLLAHQCVYRAMLLDAASRRDQVSEALQAAADLAARLPVEDDEQASVKALIQRLHSPGVTKRKRRRPKKP